MVGLDFYNHLWWLNKKHPSTTNDNTILGRWLGISHKIGRDICYWVLTRLGKVITRTMVQNVIHTNLIDPDMKQRIEIFDEELEKRLDHTKFVDDSGTDLYIDDVDRYNEVAHGYGCNTQSDEAYGEMMADKSPEQYDIDDTTCDKYIGAEVIIDATGKYPRKATFRRCDEELDGEKVGTYHWNQLMDTREYELEYDNGTHDCYFANVIADDLY